MADDRTPNDAQPSPQRTPLDLTAPELNQIATEAFTEAARATQPSLDALIDQIAAMPCIIDCTGKTKETLSDQLIQIARGIQRQRKASPAPSTEGK